MPWLPGLALCLLLAAAAQFFASEFQLPVMLLALAGGFVLRPWVWGRRRAALWAPGVQLTAKRVLRLGVALLGSQVTVQQIAALGLAPIVVVLVAVSTTIVLGTAMGPLVLGRRGWGFALLTSGSVAICGASAALALFAVLPPRPQAERETLLTILAVTALSTLAMIVYPLLFSSWGFSPQELGLLLGGSIHDVAQVVGAGYGVSETTGDTATYVKLLRVALLPLVVLFVAFFNRRAWQQARSVPPFPWFALGFLGILVLNSCGLLPLLAQDLLPLLARGLLVAAIIAVGLKTALADLAGLGFRPLLLITAQTAVLLLLILCLLTAVPLARL